MASIKQFLPIISGISDMSSLTDSYDSYSIDEVIDSLKYLCWDNKDKRYALWVLVVMMTFGGRDSQHDRNIISSLAHKWENDGVIDSAIFHEMKDTAETYRLITIEDNKRDLDQSIKDLIELG